jgi:microcystin-dependent protein
LWSGFEIPEGWMACDGEFLSNQENPTLYSIIGDTFGSAESGGEKYFKLPKISNPKSSQHLRYIICSVGYLASDLEGFTSSIKWFAGKVDTLPTVWQKCKGQEVAITSNPVLYSLIETTYGGGEGGFSYPTLPDLTPGVSTVMCLYGIYPRHI